MVKSIMKHVSFSPKGVCAQQIDFDVDEGGALHNVKFVGGCNGNLKAIGLLVEGQDASSISKTLRGNICGFGIVTASHTVEHGHEGAAQRIG